MGEEQFFSVSFLHVQFYFIYKILTIHILLILLRVAFTLLFSPKQITWLAVRSESPINNIVKTWLNWLLPLIAYFFLKQWCYKLEYNILFNSLFNVYCHEIMDINFMCYKYIMIASMVGGSVEEKEDWRKENSRQGKLHKQMYRVWECIVYWWGVERWGWWGRLVVRTYTKNVTGAH